MKYKGVAIGLSRNNAPVITFSAHLDNIRDWARLVAKKEKCKVEIYVYEERLLETIQP